MTCAKVFSVRFLSPFHTCNDMDDIWRHVITFLGHAAKHRLRRVNIQMKTLVQEMIARFPDPRVNTLCSGVHLQYWLFYENHFLCRECCYNANHDTPNIACRTNERPNTPTYVCTRCLHESNGYREVLRANQAIRPVNMRLRKYQFILDQCQTAFIGKRRLRFVWASDWRRVCRRSINHFDGKGEPRDSLFKHCGWFCGTPELYGVSPRFYNSDIDGDGRYSPA